MVYGLKLDVAYSWQALPIEKCQPHDYRTPIHSFLGSSFHFGLGHCSNNDQYVNLASTARQELKEPPKAD